MSQPTPELTLTLFRREPGVYPAWLRYRSGDEDTDEPVRGTVYLDPNQLAGGNGWANADIYGRDLKDHVFKDPALRTGWAVLRKNVPKGQPLRVRLELEEYALELHRVRWECLHDPDGGGPLLVDQGVWFSRYLLSSERPFGSRAGGGKRVLVAVICPPRKQFEENNNLRIGRQLLPADWLDVPAEVRAITGWLRAAGYQPDDLQNPTLDALVEKLRYGTGYDILYLVAHGGVDSDGAKLLTVGADGVGKPVLAKELVDGLRQRVRFLPRLVVLSSCKSAGGDAATEGPPPAKLGGELDAALGPQLGRAGVPAVVAMLGNVRRTTADLFIRTFFEKLKDGQVDAAAAAARQAVYPVDPAGRAPDYWAPVLYTRLTSGRLWRDPSDKKFDGWDGLLRRIRGGRCVPVLGSGVLEPLVGTTHELAERLLKGTAGRPPSGHADLPQAAQFYGAMQGPDALRPKYLEALAEAVRDQFGRDLAPAAELGPWAPKPADQYDADAPAADAARRLLVAAVEVLKAETTAPPGAGAPAPGVEAHEVLARLGCPLYLSTNPDDLLARALARRAAPAVQVCNWLTTVVPRADPPAAAPAAPPKPTPEAPLVCHLFGHLSDPRSVVLSENDYFRVLVGMAEKDVQKRTGANSLLAVNTALAQSRLLFLGFRLDDWDFRAFLNFFLTDGLVAARHERGITDVAVQLDPDDGRNTDPGRVRRYLEKLFGSRISIYWGSTHEFLQELSEQWDAHA